MPNNISLDTLLREVEDTFRHGYGVGYAEGYSKQRDPHSIERGTFSAVLEHKIKELKAKYDTATNHEGANELGHS